MTFSSFFKKKLGKEIHTWDCYFRLGVVLSLSAEPGRIFWRYCYWRFVRMFAFHYKKTYRFSASLFLVGHLCFYASAPDIHSGVLHSSQLHTCCASVYDAIKSTLTSLCCISMTSECSSGVTSAQWEAPMRDGWWETMTSVHLLFFLCPVWLLPLWL